MTTHAIIVYMSFADWLLTQLAYKKMSQSDLARNSGLTKQAITNYVSGRIPDRKALQKLAKGLKLPTETLLRAAGILPAKVDGDEWVEEIDHKIKQIKSPTARRAIERMIDGFATDEETEQIKQRKSKPRPAGS